MDVRLHAVDSFSIRYLETWLNREDKKMGIGEYLATLAEEALEQGVDVSKKRHKDDGQRKRYKGMTFVFTVENDTGYRALVTVM